MKRSWKLTGLAAILGLVFLCGNLHAESEKGKNEKSDQGKHKGQYKDHENNGKHKGWEKAKWKEEQEYKEYMKWKARHAARKDDKPKPDHKPKMPKVSKKKLVSRKAEVTCPKCGHGFWAEIKKVVCEFRDKTPEEIKAEEARLKAQWEKKNKGVRDHGKGEGRYNRANPKREKDVKENAKNKDVKVYKSRKPKKDNKKEKDEDDK